jgi:hypothetical protein
MRSASEQLSFKDLVQSDPWIRERLSAAEIAKCFDLRYHTKHIKTIFAQIGLARRQPRQSLRSSGKTKKSRKVLE